MAHNLTQKLKQSIAKNEQTKITFNAPVNVQTLINDYVQYFSDIESARISYDLLLSNVIESALNSDKEFQKWQRESKKDQAQQALKIEQEEPSSFPFK